MRRNSYRRKWLETALQRARRTNATILWESPVETVPGHKNRVVRRVTVTIVINSWSGRNAKRSIDVRNGVFQGSWSLGSKEK